MPKLPSSLADVSTKVVPMEEGTYSAVIDEVELTKSKSKLDMVVVTYKIVDHEIYAKREIKDYFVLETKEHEPNESGLRNLKRLIVATVGEDRANDEEFDTDELEGQQVTLVVKQESYEADGEEGVSNRVKKVLPA
jgi:hypothetical protein